MKSNTDDYLKYWRVIRQYIKVKYELQQEDLDMLLFLYSEKYFSKDKFDEYNTLMSWSTTRFYSLRKRGWIEMFRKKMKNRRAVYKLSSKAINLIRLIYKKLRGEEIPTNSGYNKMFAKNVSYSDKVYRNMIIKMNEDIRQQLRQTHGSKYNVRRL